MVAQQSRKQRFKPWMGERKQNYEPYKIGLNLPFSVLLKIATKPPDLFME